jgi:tryptophanyl-tRNA synthetase
MSEMRILSGIQPSGTLHLGNYIGALQHFVKLQDEAECYFCVVDYHAITVPQDPQELRQNIRNLAALYLAAGLDPDKMSLFVQSDVSAHTEMGWIMTTFSYMGELQRMTQYKDKAMGKDNIPAGLFAYPSLMAADILLYQATNVPVGEDQKQQLELTRNLAERFNNRFGDTFTVTEPLIPEVGARIMSLDDPTSKMSKSNPNPNSYISLLDEPKVIEKKIKRAVTDSDNEIRFDPQAKPAVSNLLSMYSLLTGKTMSATEAHFAGSGYGALKKELAEVTVDKLRAVQERFEHYSQSSELENILKHGAVNADMTASKTLAVVKEKIGLGCR